MKKMLIVMMAMVFIFAVVAYGESKYDVNGSTTTKQKSAPKENKSLNQLKGVERHSTDAKRDAEKGNLRSAKEKAGRGFDTPAQSSGTVKSPKTTRQDPKEISRRENEKQKERDRERSRKYKLDDPSKAPPKPK
jgi:hypothetical protein